MTLAVEGDRVILQTTDSHGDPIEAYGDEFLSTFADQLVRAARQASNVEAIDVSFDKPFDESEVFRVEGVVAWYHIPGVTMLRAGSKEGPAHMTALETLALSRYLSRGVKYFSESM
ncbi:MAG TPA: hypothetical protein VND22_04785 [Actinomycetota bacterium]|nr:hypothetical protein [Actinomycetota bacterium]